MAFNGRNERQLNARFLHALISYGKRTFLPSQFALDNGLPPATVYRNLAIAQSLGLVRSTDETVFRSRKFGAGGGRSRVWAITGRFVLAP
jgi:hypothetical protein